MKMSLHEVALAEGMRLATKEFTPHTPTRQITREHLASLLALAYTLGAAHTALEAP